MNRAWATLGVATVAAVGATWYAHMAQVWQRNRMHEGVLRDIAKEAREQLAVIQAVQDARAADGTAGLAVAAGAGATGTTGPVCENGICDLSATRFRDPKTGAVYVPEEEGRK